jgi:hypothetical protein
MTAAAIDDATAGRLLFERPQLIQINCKQERYFDTA